MSQQDLRLIFINIEKQCAGSMRVPAGLARRQIDKSSDIFGRIATNFPLATRFSFVLITGNRPILYHQPWHRPRSKKPPPPRLLSHVLKKRRQSARRDGLGQSRRTSRAGPSAPTISSSGSNENYSSNRRASGERPPKARTA